MTASPRTAELIERDPAREAALRELSDPRYAADDPTLLQRVTQWVFDKLGEFLDRAVAVVPGGWWGLLIVALVLGAVAVAVIVAGRRVLQERRAGIGSAAVFDERGPLTAAAHRTLAEQAERDGQWDDAVRSWFRATVRGVEERGLLLPRPGRTADEAAREVGRLLDLTPRLIDAARVFDDVSFGGRAATADQARAFRELDADVRDRRPVMA
jgi:hypothetical protein